MPSDRFLRSLFEYFSFIWESQKPLVTMQWEKLEMKESSFLTRKGIFSVHSDENIYIFGEDPSNTKGKIISYNFSKTDLSFYF